MAELAALDRAAGVGAPDGVAASGAVMISAIGGAGGVGKTWLALTWAHRNLHRFPDGQLFVDLHGFSPTGRPISPAEALRGLLDALGVAPDHVPSGPDAQAALYRGLIAGRRMLVVLDNAATAEQVVPLLPGSPTCTVLVTGRTTLASLIDRYGARHLALDVLHHGEARDLLARRLDERRVAAELEVTDELIRLCGRHPLALAITARHAATRPGIPLAEFAAELRELGLQALDHDTDPAASLPAVLSWSLRQLTEQQRLVFALLGIIPGPDIDLSAAAALAGLSESRTRKALRVLEEHSLLDRYEGGRHRMHDLVRAYAATTAERVLPAGAGETALRRVVDFYLHTAHAADRLLNPHRQPLQPALPVDTPHRHELADDATALAWFDAEHINVIAAQRAAAEGGRYRTVADLAWALASFHERRGYLHDRVVAWQTVLDVCAHLPPAIRVRAHRHLGRAHTELGHHNTGIEHLGHALAQAEGSDDTTQQAHCHRELGRALGQAGDDRLALQYAVRALELFRTLDNPVGVANALNQAGWCAARLGEYDTARAHCRDALVLHRRHDHLSGTAATLDTLGYVEHRDGHHDRAVHHYEQALELRRELGNTYRCADTLDRLGHPLAALGDHRRARAVWEEALRLYRQQGRDDATRVQRQLDDLDGPLAKSPL
ncbi:tetratricopeptide repeat protein [Actinosynnema sp. NPDC023658]|uniref:ATP-binding protein n=1 Tax=Actinosynnema sp. NPDC023658 TaxID=3155465 RepID=UPI0033F59CEF